LVYYGLSVRNNPEEFSGKRLKNRTYLDWGKLDDSLGFVKIFWESIFMDSLGKTEMQAPVTGWRNCPSFVHSASARMPTTLFT